MVFFGFLIYRHTREILFGWIDDFMNIFFISIVFFQKNESIYERECGNMPGFAVYYRYPNSQRVTYGQFIKVYCL